MLGVALWGGLFVFLLWGSVTLTGGGWPAVVLAMAGFGFAMWAFIEVVSRREERESAERHEAWKAMYPLADPDSSAHES